MDKVLSRGSIACFLSPPLMRSLLQCSKRFKFSDQTCNLMRGKKSRAELGPATHDRERMFAGGEQRHDTHSQGGQGDATGHDREP